MCVSGSAALKSLREYQSQGGVRCNLCACECVGVRLFACNVANDVCVQTLAVDKAADIADCAIFPWQVCVLRVMLCVLKID